MTQQGSASFTIVFGAAAALLVGAIGLTFFFYPIVDGFTASSGLFEFETSTGDNVADVITGVWTFAGGIVLIAILSFVWVRTRQ